MAMAGNADSTVAPGRPDPDHVQGGCQVHAAMVTGCQVTPHHRDPVTVGLAGAASGQQPQLPCALHRRGAVTDLEFGVAVALDAAATGRGSRSP
jgi:hypothetical protein